MDLHAAEPSVEPQAPSLPQACAAGPRIVHPGSGGVREVVSFAAPIMLSSLSMSLMWVVDMLIMGRVGTVEQGAVGLAGVLTWALFCFFGGTMNVVNILVAQDDGAGRRDLARHVRTALVVALPMSVALYLLRLLVPDALGWLGASAQVRPFAQTYIQIRLFAAPFALLSFVLTSYLRGLGDSLTPMWVTLGANALNAGLAVVLVFGRFGLPALSVAGAAWATAAASTVEALAYLGIFLFGRQSRARGALKLERPPLRDIRAFLVLGLPIGLTWLFEMVAWSAFSSYAGTRTPPELAAHTILLQVTSFCFMPAVALGVAASTLVGRYLGAERPDLAWRSAKRTLLVGTGYAVVIGIAMVVLRRPLYRTFALDPAVIAVGATLALIAACYQPFDAFGIMCQGILRGAGKTAIPTYVMLGSGLLVFIPLVWYFGEARGLGVVGAWAAAVVHVVVVALVLGTVVVRGKWRSAKLGGSKIGSMVGGAAG